MVEKENVEGGGFRRDVVIMGWVLGCLQRGNFGRDDKRYRYLVIRRRAVS